MSHITDAFKGSHQYTGKINGKTFVVPHGKVDIYATNYHKAHSDETITSREHVAKHNPDFSKQEIDAVHSHIKKVHGGNMHEENKNSSSQDTLEEGRPMVGDVFHRHQTHVARQTLRMHDAAAAVAGGMSKDEARAHLAKMGWTKKQIHDHEHSLNEHGFVGFDHKGTRHEVEADSLYSAVTQIRKKANTPKSKHHLVHAKIAEKDTPDGRKQVTHTAVDESVQIDELNKSTLRSYVAKAGDAAAKHAKTSHDLSMTASKSSDSGVRLGSSLLAKSQMKKSLKRAKGVNMATKKLTNEEGSTLSIVKELIKEAAFTRRHFRQVADIIKSHPDPKKRHELASHHSEIFTKANPRFDKKRFFDAAGVKEEKS